MDFVNIWFLEMYGLLRKINKVKVMVVGGEWETFF